MPKQGNPHMALQDVQIQKISKSSNNSPKINSKENFKKISNCDSPPTKSKVKTSLFNTEREEEFNTLEELMTSINTDLVTYAKSQKGSRNLQKILNKIAPEKVDLLLDISTL